jgi:membrane associated rhomboid family serine protease
MIPLKDRNPTHKVPFVTITLIIVNVAAFLYEVSLGEEALRMLFDSYGVVPERFFLALLGEEALSDVMISFFTSMFLHGGVVHLGGNMLYLWVFGDNVEDKLGHGRFLLFYLLCGIAATSLHIFIDPTSPIPTIGASGAISGVLGAYLLMFPGARIITVIPIFVFLQVAELPALIVLGFWFVMQFFNGLLSLGLQTAGMGGVAWWAHIGGFVAGLILVVPFRKFR